MKNLILLLLILVAQPSTNAALNGARMTFRLVDEQGRPVVGATMELIMFDHHEPGDGFGEDKERSVSGQSDAQGVVTLTISSVMGLAWYRVQTPPGFYATPVGKFEFGRAAGGKWQPWNPSNQIVLKPIVAPVPLIAKRSGFLRVPAEDVSIGYDLLVGDWVSPHGKGKTNDLIFNYHSVVSRAEGTFDLKLDVTFSNLGDGFQVASPSSTQSSVLKLRTAPEDGYTNVLTRHVFRTAKTTPTSTDVDKDRNYFFRVRSEKSNGQVTNALYGKIYRDLELTANGDLVFAYYLNPTPNSRNLEFNTKSNLLNGLKSFEKPNAP